MLIKDLVLFPIRLQDPGSFHTWVIFAAGMDLIFGRFPLIVWMAVRGLSLEMNIVSYPVAATPVPRDLYPLESIGPQLQPCLTNQDGQSIFH